MLCTGIKQTDVLASGYFREGIIVITNLGVAF